MAKKIDSFNFSPGRKVGPRYAIESRLGGGSEGEVYQIREVDTGIRRAAKFYFPHVDPEHKLSIHHAQKLEALRHCPIVLQYHHSEVVRLGRQKVVALISDFCDGQPLERWIEKHHQGRLRPYLALHVLYHLVRGLEAIHALGQYHADVHSQNILIKPRGVVFDVKLIDFYDWGRPRPFKQQQDIKDTLRVFYEVLGGRAHYARQPAEIRYICAGLRRELMIARFPTMTALRQHIETFEWSTMLDGAGV
jgi:RIO-like serine/threonine protein kinase